MTDNPHDNYIRKVVAWRVIDGDTVDVQIDQGHDDLTWLRVRLARIDAPELYRKETPDRRKMAIKAKEHVVDFMKQSKDLSVTTTKRDGFRRWIGDIFGDSENLSDSLVELGFAEYRKY